MLHTGWLQKRSAESFHSSESHGSSVNRYCVLCGPFLLDFADRESFVNGLAPKREAEVIGVAPWDEGKNSRSNKMFVVMTKFGGPIVCTALDTSNREEWMESIHQVLSSTIGPLLEELKVPWCSSFATMQQQQQNIVHFPPSSSESDTCQRTGAPFGITLSRYNCISCGDACCYEACSQEIPLAQYGFESPKRICDDCYSAQLLLLHTKRMFHTLEIAVLQRRMLSNGRISSMVALTRNNLARLKLPSLLAALDLLEKQMISPEELGELYTTEEKFRWDESMNSIEVIKDSLMECMHGDATLGLIKLLHDSAQSEQFTVVQFYQVIQHLHRVVEDDLDTIGFYWPQLIHTHYLMVPMSSEDEILKTELLEDFILSMCRKSAHLAVKLIWLLNGNLEDMAVTASAVGGGSGSATSDAAGKKVNLIRLAIEVEDTMLSSAREEGVDPSILNPGVLKSLIKPTSAQSRLLMDQMMLLRQVREAIEREYGYKFRVKTSFFFPSPTPNHEETSKKRLNTAFSLRRSASVSPPFSPSSFDSFRDTSLSKPFYFESQLEFVKAIVGIADSLRFVAPPSARAPKLKSEIRRVLEGSGDPSRRLTGFVPVCSVTEKLRLIVRIPEDEGHVFNTKARAPTLYVFEVLGEVDDTMASSIGGRGTGTGEMMKQGNSNNDNSVSLALERSKTIHEVEGELASRVDPSNSRWDHPQKGGGSNNSIEGCDEPSHPELVASPSSVQEDVVFLAHERKEFNNGAMVEIEMLKNGQLQSGDFSTTRTAEQQPAAVCHQLDIHNHGITIQEKSSTIGSMYPAVFLALHFVDRSSIVDQQQLDEEVVRNGGGSSTAGCGCVEKVAAAAETEADDAEVSSGVPTILTTTNNNNISSSNGGGSITVMDDLEPSFSPLPQPEDTTAYNLSSDPTEEPCSSKMNCIASSARENMVAVPSSSSTHGQAAAQAGEGRWGEGSGGTVMKDPLSMIKYVIASFHTYSQHPLMLMIRPMTKMDLSESGGGSNHNSSSTNVSSSLDMIQLESGYSLDGSSAKEQDADRGLSEAVLQARDLYKGGLITAEELQTVLVKDSAFLELIEEHAFLDTQFCVTQAFGENWASKKNRIRELSPFGNLPGWDLVSFIAKSNDDLRQEVCALQLIQLFQRVFEEAGLDVLWLKPYQIISTGARTGLVQTLTDTQSLDALKKRGGFISLRKHFEKTYSGTDRQLKEAQRNFLRSLAAYSLICYVLQVKDRHNGNILLSSDGHIIHIDFGWLLGIAPGGSFSLESSSFKLTTEYMDVLGGLESELFFEFSVLFTTGMLVLQAAHERIVGLVEMLIDRSPYPCFQGRDKSSIICKLRARLMPHISQREMVGVCLNLIQESLNSVGTAQYDAYQYYMQGVMV